MADIEELPFISNDIAVTPSYGTIPMVANSTSGISSLGKLNLLANTASETIPEVTSAAASTAASEASLVADVAKVLQALQTALALLTALTMQAMLAAQKVPQASGLSAILQNPYATQSLMNGIPGFLRNPKTLLKLGGVGFAGFLAYQWAKYHPELMAMVKDKAKDAFNFVKDKAKVGVDKLRELLHFKEGGVIYLKRLLSLNYYKR